MSHDRAWHIGSHSNIAWKGLGGSGVDLFFAISGVLICWRILEDEAITGVFKLKDFYIRRLFRIQPAALSYLALIALLIVIGVIHEWWHFWLGGLFLYQNFLFHTQNRTLIFAGYFTGHFWTLSVEEHFYILLSLFLFFVRRYRIRCMALLYLAQYCALRIAHTYGFYSEDTSTRRTYWVIGRLIFPALLALLLRRERVYAAAQKYLRPWVAFLGAVLLAYADQVMHTKSLGTWTAWWFQNTFYSQWDHVVLTFGFLVVATMLHPRSWTTRFLELAPIRYLGRLSYSIYVWHLLFLCATEPEAHITWAPLVMVDQRPWRYFGILAVAMLSYHLIEKPMIRLGHKLAPPATPGHSDLRVEPEAANDNRTAISATQAG